MIQRTGPYLRPRRLEDHSFQIGSLSFLFLSDCDLSANVSPSAQLPHFPFDFGHHVHVFSGQDVQHLQAKDYLPDGIKPSAEMNAGMIDEMNFVSPLDDVTGFHQVSVL